MCPTAIGQVERKVLTSMAISTSDRLNIMWWYTCRRFLRLLRMSNKMYDDPRNDSAPTILGAMASQRNCLSVKGALMLVLFAPLPFPGEWNANELSTCSILQLCTA